ncbi:alpha/beta hydrolase [Pseudoalteromonas sp. OOF1S-7]|uniref:alpha/beta hydrolase n=1 Tax=Pseudoalteromonas sp. OOF1S-7 TaxID=2917757 RepID=UPI001EF429D0|nr:alpha/beta hydrolase [Pseudoalteromonas sp. OOF1S-7]MCG7536070.1 alpha/beta hydrolase [Pseudoalteromonas sp. OOF1S-7]
MTSLTLEPGIKKIVSEFISAGCPSVRSLSIAERRQGYLDSVELAGACEPVCQCTDIEIHGLMLRIYRPSAQGILPVAIYFHGGCFVSGGFETHEQQLSKLANLSGAMVIAIRYRLAPEHVYPAAHDDAFNAAQLIRQHCAQWDGDPDNISLIGDSAGGHLSLVTALRLKEKADWLPARQILIYPMLDATTSSRSYQEYGTHYVITKEALESGYELYFKQVSRTHPEASPLFRSDLAGLPETHIITAQFDPLVDEGEQLYRTLLEAGVPVQCRRYLGVIHGFFQLSAISRAARESIAQVAGLIRVQS